MPHALVPAPLAFTNAAGILLQCLLNCFALRVKVSAEPAVAFCFLQASPLARMLRAYSRAVVQSPRQLLVCMALQGETRQRGHGVPPLSPALCYTDPYRQQILLKAVATY